MGYVDEVLELVSKKNADQPEFLQAVTEVLNTLRPVVDANEELYRSNAILERITEPDRVLMFRVPWVDDTDASHSCGQECEDWSSRQWIDLLHSSQQLS